MRSYEEHPAGLPHQLVVIVKGIVGPDVLAEYEERISAHRGEILSLDDSGFDIGSYWSASTMLSSPLLCFLNSFSVILDDGWLEKMVKYEGPSVGVIGASGSWESHFSGWSAAARRGLLLPPWRIAPPPLSRRLTLRDRGWLVREWLRQGSGYPPFPNPHIRTNAFIIRKDLMARIQVNDIRSKQHALAFESGRRSLTRQIVGMNQAVLVVGRDGVAYRPSEWPQSATFRSGHQENLLVADKRTIEWLTADERTREDQARNAWGTARTHRARLPRIYRTDN